MTISEGVPSRPDFVRHTSENRAWCCAEAKSFTLEDPSLGNKTSTYVQVSDHLLLECSQNGKGKVFVPLETSMRPTSYRFKYFSTPAELFFRVVVMPVVGFEVLTAMEKNEMPM